MRTAIMALVTLGTLLALPSSSQWKPVTPTKRGDKVKILINEKAITYYRLSAGMTLEAKVKGKVRLRVHVRCEVPSNAKAPVDFDYTYAIDGQNPQKHVASAVASKAAKYDGTGAAVPGDADSLYVDIPDGEHTISLTLDKDSKQNLNVRFYTARKSKSSGTPTRTSASSRWKTLTPTSCGDKVKILVNEKAITYYRLNAATPLEVKARGEVRLRVYVRCEVPSDARAPVDFEYTYRIDGKNPQKHIAAAVGSKAAKYDGTGAAVPGDADSLYIDIPDGEHTISLTMDKDSKQNLNVRFYTPRKAKAGDTPAPPKAPGK